MKMVTIYHKVDGDLFRPWTESDGMAPVFVYVATMPHVATVAEKQAEAAHAFEMFNVDLEDLGGQNLVTASQYRALRLRSLSVGDIVCVGRDLFACERFGWKHLPIAPGMLRIWPSPQLDSAWTRDLPHDGERGANVWGR